MKLTRLYQKMTPEQMKLISDAHYGGLVIIKCSKLQPELCKFLMKCYNPVTYELVFPGRGKVPVTESSDIVHGARRKGSTTMTENQRRCLQLVLGGVIEVPEAFSSFRNYFSLGDVDLLLWPM